MGDKESEEIENSPRFFDYIGDFISNADLIKAISNAIDSWSINKPIATNYQSKFQFKAFRWGIFFSAMIFIGIGIFGYFHIISKDVTDSLLGALIGYWYGQQKQNKKENN